MGFPGGSGVKNPPANSGEEGSIPGSGRFSGERNGSPLQRACEMPCSAKCHGQRSLASYSPSGHKEWDTAQLYYIPLNFVQKHTLLIVKWKPIKKYSSLKNIAHSAETYLNSFREWYQYVLYIYMQASFWVAKVLFVLNLVQLRKPVVITPWLFQVSSELQKLSNKCMT